MHKKEKQKEGLLTQSFRKHILEMSQCMQISHRSFRHLYWWATLVSTVLMGYVCITNAVVYTPVYWYSYLLGLFISVSVLRLCGQYLFRNVLIIVFLAEFFPLLLAKALPRVLEGSVDWFLSVMLLSTLVCLVGISIYLMQWNNMIPLIRYGGLWAWGKLAVYWMRREHTLFAELRAWNDTTIERMTPAQWRQAAHDDRVAYLHKIFSTEAAVLGLGEFYASRCDASGEGKYASFSFTANAYYIHWDEDVVDYYSLGQILQAGILCLQQRQWYVSLTEEDQLRLEEKGMLQQLCTWFCKAPSTLVYDLLTEHYAEARADWYCGYA